MNLYQITDLINELEKEPHSIHNEKLIKFYKQKRRELFKEIYNKVKKDLQL